MSKYLLLFSSLLMMTACSQQARPTHSMATGSTEQPSQANTTVMVYQEGDKTIEERRVKGFLYSVKVIPKEGKPYYLINADGDNNPLQNSSPKQKIPTWTLFSW